MTTEEKLNVGYRPNDVERSLIRYYQRQLNITGMQRPGYLSDKNMGWIPYFYSKNDCTEYIKELKTRYNKEKENTESKNGT